SLCMVSGLAGIASLMLSIQRAQEAAQQTAEAALRAQQQEYETIFHAVPSEIRFKDTIPSPIWIFGLFYQKRGFKNLIESIG
ncbi:MAG TPA: hypothetical protein VLQ80_13305, partial [Candidatus Saccharimonadia bacterium]|nr:hypothetical protein [Candidatus Saccharimonadia bacterium]